VIPFNITRGTNFIECVKDIARMTKVCLAILQSLANHIDENKKIVEKVIIKVDSKHAKHGWIIC
jgi:fructose-bisphosphate aldolase class 1